MALDCDLRAYQAPNRNMEIFEVTAMPSEWDGFLEGLALTYFNDHMHDNSVELTIEGLVAVLQAKLLPLLEAGEAMRQNIGAYVVALNASPFKQEDTSRAIRGCVDGLQAWDAAREAALKK